MNGLPLTEKKTESFRGLFCDIYVLLMFFVFPLFVMPSGYKDITHVKWCFFVIATSAYALSEIFFMIKLRIRPKLSASLICVLAFFAACCLSALFSPYGSGVILGLGRYEGLLTVFFYCLCFFVLSDKPFKPKYVFFLAASGALFSILCFIQLLDKNPLSLYPGQYFYYAAPDVYSAAFLGTIGNAAHLPTFILRRRRREGRDPVFLLSRHPYSRDREKLPQNMRFPFGDDLLGGAERAYLSRLRIS